MDTRLKAVCMLALMLVMAVGCSLPQNARQSAEAAFQSYENVQATVSQEKTRFEEMQKSDDWPFLKNYSEREEWLNNFVKADAEIAHAATQKKEIEELLKRNKKEDAALVISKSDNLRVTLNRAKQAAQATSSRAQFLKGVKEEAPSMMEKAESQMAELRDWYGGVSSVLSQYKNDYPDRAEDIQARFAEVGGLFTKADSSFTSAQTQMKSSSPDYAVVGDSVKFIEAVHQDFPAADEKFRSKMSELGRSYSKVLADMRIDYFVQVGRTSWDDYSDWNTDKDFVYPETQVGEDVFEYFDDLPEDAVLATYGYGLRSKLDPKVDQGMLAKAGLSEGNAKANWPGGHDDAEYWLANSFAKYYHLYTIVQNGEESSTGWVQVSEQEFDDYWDDLGMAVLSKPYGMFEDETLDDSSPPGMAMVGNSKYGEWKKDDSGNSFWEFYGKYALLSHLLGGGPGSRYYYDDWDHWNRNYRGQGSYYGRDESKPVYGTYASSTQRRYGGSTFNRQGGFKEAAATVRTAGPSFRAGGPGGGGK